MPELVGAVRIQAGVVVTGGQRLGGAGEVADGLGGPAGEEDPQP